MVNSKDFAERLHQIMDYYKLSSAAFAEKINVQRSSISHVLSGRNKPSLDFVMKIVKAFDEVELYWLLIGKGRFPKQPSTPTTKNEMISEKSKEAAKINFPAETQSHLHQHDQTKQIERIVIFYNDGTFKEYKQ